MAFSPVYSSNLSEQALRKIFLKKRYAQKISCSKCLEKRIIWINGKRFRCKNCWSFGSLTTGTFLEKSKLSLRIWYELVWCFTLTHSARKASRLLHLNYKLCWQSYQTIRKAIIQQSLKQKRKITGTVEVDESFYGGLFKNLRKEKRWQYRYQGKAKRGRGAIYRKQPVFGIFKRNGKVYLELIAKCTKPELQEIIRRKIEKKAEVFSDAFKGYHGLVGLGYVHQIVDHGMEIYVDGRVHINGMEGFWGLSKTNMHAYKGIKKKNWLLYLKEMEFRFNNRRLDFENMALEIIKILMSYRRGDFVPY